MAPASKGARDEVLQTVDGGVIVASDSAFNYLKVQVNFACAVDDIHYVNLKRVVNLNRGVLAVPRVFVWSICSVLFREPAICKHFINVLRWDLNPRPASLPFGC